MAEMNANELAQIVGGEVFGSADTVVSDALPLAQAKQNSISFIDDAKHSERLADCDAAILLVPKKQAQEIVSSDSRPAHIAVEDVHQAFKELIPRFRKIHAETLDGVHQTANVATSSTIGRDTAIGAGVNIGADCVIGERCTIHSGVQIMAGCKLDDDCTVYPNVTLYPSTSLAKRVVVHAGCVLGANGFGYKTVDGKHEPAAQLGWVEVEDDVEIGANTCIDRGAYGPTRIRRGTKLDNLVQVGHNVQLGEHNLICSQVGIAGSSSSDEYVVMAGQVGIADHIHLNKKAVVGAQSGVMRDVPEGEVLFGSPASSRRAKMAEIASVMRIPRMKKQIKDLTTQLEALKAMLESNDTEKSRNAA